ncbi:MAG: hypothetical protein D6797_03865 [Bdellovibrio sp.]|nr:MAG: hypothetical protein D6797_03865 [Bdellovibrio sp.]
MSQWLTLTEYSLKYGVSLSTLRRRIKAGKVNSQLRGGKYYLIDEPLKTNRKQLNVPTKKKSAAIDDEAHFQKKCASSSKPQSRPSENSLEFKTSIDSSIFGLKSSIDEMLAEIKRAYALVLQEKEEQIVQLKEEVSDLKTLVHVLEKENERLKENMKEASAPIDSWLETL